jgi:hypothetical protein
MTANSCPNLADLIRLGLVPVSLHVNPLLNASFSKDVVASSNSFLKSKLFQQLTQLIKPDICIGRAAEYSLQQVLVFAHVHPFQSAAEVEPYPTIIS